MRLQLAQNQSFLSRDLVCLLLSLEGASVLQLPLRSVAFGRRQKMRLLGGVKLTGFCLLFPKIMHITDMRPSCSVTQRALHWAPGENSRVCRAETV